MTGEAETDRTEIVTVTDKAAAKLRELMEKEPGLAGLRLGTVKRGCSGLAYTLEPVKAAVAGDVAVPAAGVTLFVDADSIAYLTGTVMDYNDGLFESGFTFENPNAKGSCGCGESFTV